MEIHKQVFIIKSRKVAQRMFYLHKEERNVSCVKLRITVKVTKPDTPRDSCL